MSKLKIHIFPHTGLIYSIAFLLYVLYLLTAGNPVTELTFEGKLSADPYIEKICILTFYSFLALLPFVFLFVTGKDEINAELNSTIDNLLNIPKNTWKIYLLFFLLFAVFYIWLSYFHIPTLDGRVRWFSDRVPPFPYDPPFHTRLALIVSWFLPIEIVSPIISIVCIFIWYLFLIYLNGDKSTQNPIVALCLIFSNAYILKNSYFANMELPTAIFGVIGLYAIRQKKYTTGILAATVSCIFKVTGVFYAAVAGFLIAYHIFKDRRNFKKINLSLLAACAIFVLFNMAGLFYYILKVRGGPSYILQTDHEGFFLSSCYYFLRDFFSKYIFIFLPALIGILHKSKYRQQYLLLFSLLFVLRCTSRLSGGYYTLFFVPILSFLSFLGISYISQKNKSLPRKFARSINCILLIIILLQFFVTLPKANKMNINKYNSNFISLTHKLAKELPENTTIYQRKISLKPYLKRLGRRDLVYHHHSEDKSEVLDLLKKDGPLLLLHPKNDLGITNEELGEIGFEKSYDLTDITDHWRILFKKNHKE